VVIENAVAAAPAEPVRETTERQRRGRFGFFGQLTPFKGVDVLLEAVASVPERDWAGNSLVIHGAHLDRQPPEFQARVKALLGAAGERVVLKGSYRPHELPRLMAEVDWVVVPSIWWENSPLVIQEAFAHGRPVIASNIGGMAEKVLHGRNGLTVVPGNVPALVETLLEASKAKTWSKLRSGVVPPVPAAAIATWHRRLYQTLLEGRKRTAEVA
jgi:glycosyltransferase involved in cell wall biosynthesis